VSTRKRHEPIKKIQLQSGTVYRFVIDIGRKPKLDGATGKPMLDAQGRQVMMRDQRTHTFPTYAQARTERARILADKSRGTLVRSTKKTLVEHVDEWLAGRRTIRASTLANYRNALIPVLEQLGPMPLQDITKAHIDAVVNTMLAGGRRVGIKGRPLAPATVALTLTVLAMALDDAVKQGLLVRNVARLVDRPSTKPQTEMATWTAEQASAFLAHVAGDRLAVAWQFALYGLRRGEALGARWSDVDLEAGTLTVRITRTIVDGKVVESEPKTERGKRTLPLDTGLVAGLRKLKAHQAAERLHAGSAYAARCGDCGEAHLFVDELGEPVHPESFSDRFEVLVRQAGLPTIRLHDTRHTCGTLMHLRGVPTAVISAWLGHANAAFTLKTYVHSQADALRDAGATISTAYKAM
jgi:integrase